MSNNPILMSTGLVSLDIVRYHKSKTPTMVDVGGSCGNVTSILSYFGWDTYPVIRLGTDLISKKIVENLEKSNVKLDFLKTESKIRSPLIYEEIYTDDKNNYVKHKFVLKCNECSFRFGQFYPILTKYVDNGIKQKLSQIEKKGKIKYFYFDRVSPGIINLLNILKNKGVIIIYEPQNLSQLNKNEYLASLVNVIKISKNRNNSLEKIKYKNSDLIIETHSSNGVRYFHKGQIIQLNPFKINNIVDTSGAGDWLTAGIIYSLNNLNKYPNELTKSEIDVILNFGQALASIKCNFIGPKSVMKYFSDSAEILNNVNKIINKENIELPEFISENAPFEYRCQSCKNEI